jgi:hypothetical protein
MFSNASLVAFSNIQCSPKLMQEEEAMKNTTDGVDSI